MISYIKEFKYTLKTGEISNRRCLVLREDAISFDGIELTYLSKEDECRAIVSLKGIEVTDDLSNHEDELKSASWWNYYRRYNKNKVLEDVDEEKEN